MQTASGYGGSNRRMLDEVVDVELATAGQQYLHQGAVPQQQALAVKQERHDEHEINELAAKIVESNKAHLAKQQQQQALQQQQLLRQQQLGSAQSTNGNGNILNYFGRKTATTVTPANGTGMAATTTGVSDQQQQVAACPTSPTGSTGGAANAGDEKKAPSDEESQLGHFGWHTCNKTANIPYIVRGGEKYCAVRIVETKLLNKYLNYLHQDIYNCTCVRSYYITEAESRLLNEINQKHCDNQFGRELFTHKDLVVRLSDVNKFYTFLDVCYRKLMMGNSGAHSEKCGFIRINKESVVPYTVRDNQKYVPLFYFEGETENLKLKADSLSGWDLSYLKFCCKVQGIRNELFASDHVAVISLTDIKSYFPPGIEFEDYWPSKVVDSQLLISKNGANGGSGSAGMNSGAHWTRQPSQPPPKPAAAAVPAKQPPPTNPVMTTHAMYAAAQQLQVQQTSQRVAAAAAQQRAKQATGMANNLVFNNVANVTAANGARGGVNVPLMAGAAAGQGRNTGQLDAARMLTNAWSNLSAQEQYQLRMAETNAYATNTLQSFNYSMLQAMQGNSSTANRAAAGQGAPPPLVSGTGSQGTSGRNGQNSQHLSSVNQTGASSSSSPSLSLLFPSSSPSSLLSPPIAPPSLSGSGNKRAYATDVLQQLGAYQAQQQQQQSAASMAATISYLHSSLSMTPTSPQTSSTAGTPVPVDIGQMVFGSPLPSATTDQAVAKANSARASVVVQKQLGQKAIPPPPSLIPMSAAGSLLGNLGSNKDMQKIQDTLQHLHNLKNLTATFVTRNNNKQQQQQQHQQQNKQDPLTLAGFGHYRNNPNLATIRPAAGGGGGGAQSFGGAVGGGGGGNGRGNVAVPDYMLRNAAGGGNSGSANHSNSSSISNSRPRSNYQSNSAKNNTTMNHHYLNQMLRASNGVPTTTPPATADVIDLSSTTTPTRSNASAVAAAALQQHQQYLHQQQYFQQQQAVAAVQQQQQQQQQRMNRNGGGNADLASCLNLLASGNQTVVGRGRGGGGNGAVSEDLAANLMNKTAMANAPYKMQKAYIDGVQVTCINMKAYQHSELLMRVQDLCDKFFPQSTHENCRRVLEVFNVVIYRGNSQQIKLFSTQLHQRSDYMELVQVKDVTNYMPQLRYIIKSQSQEHSMQQQQSQAPPNKRTRIS